MATPAHSYTTERQGFHRPRPRSADQIALERWGARERRLAQSVVAILDELHEGEWQWDISDNFFGVPADSQIITGITPNGDGTHSGLIFAGWPMELLAQVMHGVGMEVRRPKTYTEILLEHVHWLDPFWGPLPLPYYLTQWIKETPMTDISQKADAWYKKNGSLVQFGILLVAVIGFGIHLGNKISDTNARIGHMEAAIYGDPLSEKKNGLDQRAAKIEEALYGPDRNRPEDGMVFKVNEMYRILKNKDTSTSTDNGSSTPPIATNDPAKR